MMDEIEIYQRGRHICVHPKIDEIDFIVYDEIGITYYVRPIIDGDGLEILGSLRTDWDGRLLNFFLHK